MGPRGSRTDLEANRNDRKRAESQKPLWRLETYLSNFKGYTQKTFRTPQNFPDGNSAIPQWFLGLCSFPIIAVRLEVRAAPLEVPCCCPLSSNCGLPQGPCGLLRGPLVKTLSSQVWCAVVFKKSEQEQTFL